MPQRKAQRRSPALLGALLAACASEPATPGRIERAAAGETVLVAAPGALTLDEIVARSRAGQGAEEIVAALRATPPRIVIDASQVVELRLRGVDLRVLDHLIDAERQALRDETAAELARRDQACAERINAEVAHCRMQSLLAPAWPMFPRSCLPPRPGSAYWRCF